MRSLHGYFAGYGYGHGLRATFDWLTGYYFPRLVTPTPAKPKSYTHGQHSRRNLSLTWGSPTTLKMPADPSIA